MDKGRFMFVVVIPPQFENDLRAGRHPDIQVNIDATAMQQAGIGANYIKNIINDRIASFLSRTDVAPPQPINLVVRRLFNPNGDLLLVYECGGHHQSDHSADGRSDGRRGDPRTRARDAGTPAGDAADRLRDRHGEGLGQWPGDPHRDGGLALSDCEDGAAGAVRRFDPAVVRRRRALSVLRDGARDIPRDDFAVDGAVRAFDHSGGRRAAASFGREYSCREPAAMAAVPHVLPAFTAFCQLFAGDHLSRRRH